MDLINEEIKEVLTNNNTAQERLQEIVEATNKQVSELVINEPLNGDVDFSVLEKNGFAFIDDIVLPEGKITSITNLPSRLKKLIIQGQLLKKVENLPTSLIELNVSFNYLSKIDVSSLKNLEILDIANNKLTSLTDLPDSLKELNCSENELTKMDFDKLHNLKKVNISNNKITSVENLSDGVEEFLMENNPAITFQNSVVPNMEDSEKDTDDERMKDYYKALNKYFQLKKKYDDEVYQTKLSIYQTYSKKEAKKRIANVKPKCINCRKPGGTLFKYEDFTHYAICDVKGTPCELNIEIQTGDLASVEDLYSIFKEDTDNLKDSIIRHKLDALFNYVNENVSIDIFKKELTSYNETSDNFKHILEQYNEIYNNHHKRDKINALQFDLKEKIQKYKSLLKEYQETNNAELLTLATEYNIKEIMVVEQQIRDLKYVLMEMDNSVMYNKLIQKQTFPANVEALAKAQQRVIKFQV